MTSWDGTTTPKEAKAAAFKRQCALYNSDRWGV
jgi:hypothetical protein